MRKPSLVVGGVFSARSQTCGRHLLVACAWRRNHKTMGLAGRSCPLLPMQWRLCSRSIPCCPNMVCTNLVGKKSGGLENVAARTCCAGMKATWDTIGGNTEANSDCGTTGASCVAGVCGSSLVICRNELLPVSVVPDSLS
eukprot:67894-Amphidinium_carterae.5